MGTIARIHLDKGFGFLACHETAKHVFFHAYVLRNARMEDLHVGQAVWLELELNAVRGPRALSVVVGDPR